MISVEQALRLILKNSHSLSPISIPLDQSLGLTLAKNVPSPSDYPLYDVSAMDGYALKASDLEGASKAKPVTLKVRGTQHAGDFLKPA